MIKLFVHLISPKTDPALRVTNTVFPSGPPTTCTSPALMMYISRPTSPCSRRETWAQEENLESHTFFTLKQNRQELRRRLYLLADVIPGKVDD